MTESFTLTDGATFSYDLFIHQTLPEGAFAAGPGGDDLCNGRGVDNALDCLGIPTNTNCLWSRNKWTSRIVLRAPA